MSAYQRLYVPGGMYFFTLVVHERRPILTTPPGIDCLRGVFRTIMNRFPFRLDAVVILPDHLHTIWTLPEGDANYSTRWRRLKEEFTRAYLRAGGNEGTRSRSRRRRQERAVWQRRFWEHNIRDEPDLERHADYLHYNPVKHGLVVCPRDWPHSSFHQWVEQGIYAPNWVCAEHGPLQFADLDETAMA
jgi:putative transposase